MPRCPRTPSPTTTRSRSSSRYVSLRPFSVHLPFLILVLVPVFFGGRQGHLADGKALEAKINFLLVTMDNAEDLVTLKLNIAQNELLTANTSLAVLAVTIAFGAYVAGVFGMNLDIPDGIEFAVVFAVTMVIIVVGTALIMGYYQWEGVLPTRVRVREDVIRNDRRQRGATRYKAEVEAVGGPPPSSRRSTYGSTM